MSHLSSVPNDPAALRVWLAERGHVVAEAPLPEAPEKSLALTIELTLCDAEPRVWRRLVVPGSTTLDRLHDVVQVAMGWTDSHLHRFYADSDEGERQFVTAEDIAEGEPGKPEDEVRIDQLLRSAGDVVRYEYDFGDGWEHQLRLTKTGPLRGKPRPRCTDGAGACPPEDVGGVHAYAEVAGWVQEGRPRDGVPSWFSSYEHATEWLGPDWHPDAFDVAEADRLVQALAAGTELLDRLAPGALDAVGRLSPARTQEVAGWLASAARTSLSAQDVEALAAPYRTLLDTVGDGVTLTSAGHLPPAVVQELCPALGIDPILAGKANREHNVRPLQLFRDTARRAGLLRVARRQLMPTIIGTKLAHDAPALWRHVADRLPLGHGELEVEVGWFTLLALAGGVGRREVFDTAHRLTVDAGWVDEEHEPIARYALSELIWPTLTALIGARWNSREPWPTWVQAAAASVVFEQPPS